MLPPHKGKRMLANIKLAQNKLECLSLKKYPETDTVTDFLPTLTFENGPRVDT